MPVLEKIAIGIGETPTIGRQSVEQLALPIYNITLGVSPSLVTLALGITRMLDAFTDPIAGTISDNTRSRFGRRKPYMLGATFVCAATLPLIWTVGAGWSEFTYFSYFLATMVAFYVAYSFFNVPIAALAMEATPDYHERTRVAAYKCFFTYAMGVFSYWLFAITQLKTFGGTLHGARVVGVIMGALVLVSGLVPILFVREGYRHVAVAKKGMSLIRGVRETFKNKAFLFFCIIATGNKISGAVIQSMGFYMLGYYVCQGDLKAAALLAGTWGTFYHVTTVTVTPAVTWMSTRLGKVRSLQICLCVFAVGAISTWFLYRPGAGYLVLLSAILIGPGQTGFYTVTRSMIADICDDDELRTGLRREGMYASMDSWIEKAMGSAGVMLTGFLLTWSGFDRVLGGHQAGATILALRICYVAMPLFGAALAFTALYFFPLTESRAIHIRRELEARRGTHYAH